MGTGAPKKFTAVTSIETLSAVIAAEANAEEAFRDVADCLQMLFEGNDTPAVWRNIEKAKQTLEYRNRILYGEIDKMIRSQEKG